MTRASPRGPAASPPLPRVALASLALVAGLSACASAGGPSPADGPAGRDGWARRVAPFPVADAEGVPYDLPFLGGFNVPRPQLVDIDGDGDLDLFVQEWTDRLLFFERVPAESATAGGNGPRSGATAGGNPSRSGATAGGSSAAHRYLWRPERFADLRVGEWFRFVDVDSDGDADLLAEEPFSYMRLYHNRGSAAGPDFVLVADTLRDTAGDAIFSDRQNIPNAADIDCDGMLDLFIGRLVGTVTRYEATGEIGAGVAPFRHITDRFEDIEIIGQQQFEQQLPGRRPPGASPPGTSPPGTGRDAGAAGAPSPPGAGRDAGAARAPSLHGANTMALADHDGDGDTDMFWGDFFEDGLLLIENSGSCESPNLRTEPRPFPLDDPISTSGYNAPTFGDTDGDGDLDLVMGVLGGAYNANTTTADNLLYFEQADGSFELRTERYLRQIDVGSESVPALLDLDGDGDLDLLLSNKIDPDDLNDSVIYRFENVGGPTSPAFRLAGTFDVEGAYHNAPAFGDLDGDGDLDLLLGTWRDQLRYLENDGGGAAASGARERAPGDGSAFTLVDSAFVELTRGSNATPALGDLDGDGDLDLLVGESSGTVNFYRNDGSPAEPRFTLVDDEYLGIDVGRRSAPALVDIDGDGDLDLAIGTESEGILLYRNDGTPGAPDLVPAPSPFPDDVPPFAVPAFADVDGDGDLDLLVGGAGGGLHMYENTGG